MTKKFSQFVSGGDVEQSDIIVGLRDGKNTQFTFPGAGIKDSHGFYLLQYTSTTSIDTNYPLLVSQGTGEGVIYTVDGVDANSSISIRAKALGSVLLQSTSPSPITIFSGTAYQHTTTFAMANTANNVTVTWPDASGTVLLSGGSGFVYSITGTADQIIASSPTGDVILSLPQSIATTSNVIFNELSLNALTASSAVVTNGGKTLASLPYSSSNIASSLVERDVSGNFSAGTITASLNGNATTATTATNIAGGSANYIPYQTSAGTTSFISSAASSILTTNGSSVPSWVNSIPISFIKYTYPTAVQETLQARLQQYVSVMDFGAKGDGVTDDTTAINNALACTTATCLYFPAGNYIISGSLTFFNTSQVIFGAGIQNTTLTTSASGATIIVPANFQGWAIKDLGINRAISSQPATVGMDGISVLGLCNLAIIDNVFVQNCYNGLSLSCMGYGYLTNCLTFTNISNGIFIGTKGTAAPMQWSIQRCLSEQNGGYGVLIHADNGATAVGDIHMLSTFDNALGGIAFTHQTPSDGIYGIRMYDSFLGSDVGDEVYLDNNGGYGNVFSNVYTEIGGANGFNILSGSGQTSLINCNSIGHQLEGVVSSASEISIIGGQYDINGQAGTSGHKNGIHIKAGTAIVNGASITRNPNYGIYCENDEHIITNNYFNSNTTDAIGSSVPLVISQIFGNLPNTLDTNINLVSPMISTSINDYNNNKLIGLTSVGSSVNYIAIQNSATSGNPSISAAGSDATIGIVYASKGSAGHVFLGTPSAVQSWVNLGSTGDILTHSISSLTAARTTTWQDASGTVIISPSPIALNMNSHLINNLSNPVSAMDAATKYYVDTAVSSALVIQGNWDASTNTPTLTAGIGTVGFAYYVDVAGTQTLPSGTPTTYAVGDVIYYGANAIWNQALGGAKVISLAGLSGVLSLNGTANEIIVTPVGTTITLSTPQAIGTSSSPIFSGLTLSGLTASYAVVTNGSSVLASLQYTNANTASTIVSRDSSGNFSAGTITSALTGTASGNTTYSANQYGIVVSGSTNAMVVIAPDASTAKVLVSGGASANPVWSLITNTNLSGSAAISNANLAAMASSSITVGTVKGNISGSSSTPSDIVLTSANTASSVVYRDASGNFIANNISANNFLSGYTTTVTAAGTTTLTVSSTEQQYFTGSTTQTVVLPVTSTLALGFAFYIVNNSSGIVTIQSSGTNTIQAMAAGSTLLVTCILTSGTTAASWNADYNFQSGANVTSITGTANQVIVSSPTGAVTLSLPQSIATSSSPQFTGLNLSGLTASAFVVTDSSKNLSSLSFSNTPLTTPLITTGIKDVNGNIILGFTPAVSATNHLVITNTTGAAITLSTTVGGSIILDGGVGTVSLHGTGSSAVTFFDSANPTHFIQHDITSLTTNRMVAWPDASGTVLLSGGSGFVYSITGTANQVIASSSTGNVTLSLPQSIATGSSPTFASLTLTAPLTSGNGGTGINNGSSTITLGGSLTTSGAFASTFTMTNTTSVTFPTSGTLATTTGTIATATNIAGGATNQIVYQTAASTTGFISTANNGVLVTSAGGVPSISSTIPANIAMTTPLVTTGIKDTNGNLIFGFSPSASAVNYYNIVNAPTGFGATIAAFGSDTNIPARIFSKGNSSLILYADGGVIFSNIATTHTLTNDISSITTSRTATWPDASGTVVLTASSPTLTNVTATQFIDTNFTANSSTAITLALTNGLSQIITLTGNATITMPASPSAGTEITLLVTLTQDGTGSRTVAWSGVTWATTGGVNPAINSAIGASTYFSFTGTSAGWIGYAANQNIGVTDASVAAAGFIGEIVSSSIAIGSATSLTTNTAKNITSISLTPGDWLVSANIGFIANTGTLATILTGSISTTTGTQATAPNGGAFFTSNVAYAAATTNVFPTGTMVINISTTTTVFLVATATFTVSTMTGFGSISAQRFR